MRRALRALRASGFLRARGLAAFAAALAAEGPNASALLGFRARTSPRRPALADGVEDLDWRTLHRRVERLARVLAQSHGVRSGDRAALLARRGIPFAEAFYALCRSGCHVTVLNPDLGSVRRMELISSSGFDVVVSQEESMESSAGAGNPIRVDLEAARRTARDLPPGFLGPRRGGRISVYTGGTTGKPKTAQRTSSPFAVVRPFLGLLSRVGLHECRELAVCSSVHHGFGLSALLIGTFLGPRLHVWDRWDTRDVSDRIRQYGIDSVVAVPLMLSRLLDADASALSGVERFLCGGSRLDPTLARRGLEAMGGGLHNLYGSSEAGFSVLALPDDLREAPDSLGRSLGGVRVRILDPSGAEVARGATGEICVDSGWAMESVAGRTCRTGDLGWMDARGRIFLTGRVDDMVVCGGENVHPSDLEKAAMDHPDVQEAAAWPVDDPVFDRRLALAVVVSRQDLTPQALREWLRGRVARYQTPARILVVEAIPWTAAGKPDRQALERLARGEVTPRS